MTVEQKKGKAELKEVATVPEPRQKTCFVIMPIADHPEYPAGHFMRVYEYIIKPACIKAGFVPHRADDAQHTHVIMMNILQRILDADLAICDLSSKNPNVMYELGVRQAFDKPVTLIKDEKTDRVFDLGMLSDVEYKSGLRIDDVEQAIEAIAVRLRNTYEKKDEKGNSLIQLMQIQPAASPQPTVVSPDTSVLLDAINTLGKRISAIESQRPSALESFSGTISARSIAHGMVSSGLIASGAISSIDPKLCSSIVQTAPPFGVSKYLRLGFASDDTNVSAFITVLSGRYSALVNTIPNPDGSKEIEFRFNTPVSITADLINSIAESTGAYPTIVSLIPPTSGWSV